MKTEMPASAPECVPAFDRVLDADSGGDGIDVEISNTQSHLPVDRQAVTRLVCGTLAAEGVGRASISVAVVDDATIRLVNRRYLDHDWPTDVISFALSETRVPELDGELIVSAEMAITTARQANVNPWDELALYVVHGLLHLCGHDDSSPDASAAMRRREGEILARAGLSNTFPTVAAPGDDPSAAEADPGERERVRWVV
jgi:probable rRNA maturation factor